MTNRIGFWVQVCLVLTLVLLGVGAVPGGAVASSATASPLRAGSAGGPSPAAARWPVPGPQASADALSKTGIAPSALSLQWNETTDLCFMDYNLEYSTAGAGGPWVSLGLIYNATSTADYVYRLRPSTTYWWALVDTDCTGGSATSNVLQVAQPAVAALSVSLVSPTSAAFNWTNPATYGGLVGFQSYQIQASSGGSWNPWGSPMTSEATRAYLATGLTPNTNYSFNLVTTEQCVNCFRGTYSTSSVSNTVQAVTPAPLRATLQAASADFLQATRFVCAVAGGESPFNYSWDFGDGSHATTTSALENHTYGIPGSFTASCIVVDHFGEQATGSVTATVTLWWVIGVVVGAVGAVVVAILLLRRRRRAQAAPPPVVAPPPPGWTPPASPLPQGPPLPPPPGPPPAGP